MPSVLGGMHQLGLDINWAWRAQGVAAIAAALLVGHIWWAGPNRADRPELARAILCLATLLAVPMVYLYDLMLLVPAVAWIWADMRRFGHRQVEAIVLTAVVAAILGLRELHPVGPAAGVMLVAALLGLALARFHAPTSQITMQSFPAH